MLHEDDRLSARLRRPVVIFVLVALALLGPTWLWFVRGRQLPLRVVVQPERYVVAAGSTIDVTARITPVSKIELRWSGPGLSGEETRTRWQIPAEPGLYTATLTVRRSASTVKESVSVVATTGDPSRYPLDLPPSRPANAPETTLPPCGGHGKKWTIELVGKRCRGSNLVVSARGAGQKTPWFWWKGSPEHAQPGPLANLRIPRQHDSATTRNRDQRLELIAGIVDRTGTCSRRTRKLVTLEPCSAGPRLGKLFAEFGWRVMGPAIFRLSAKPPRTPTDSPPRYHWRFGDGKSASKKTPTVVHRYSDGKAQHIVRLTLQSGTERVQTVKVITDRTAATTEMDQK